MVLKYNNKYSQNDIQYISVFINKIFFYWLISVWASAPKLKYRLGSHSTLYIYSTMFQREMFILLHNIYFTADFTLKTP